jgi:hypothetical protein
MKFTLTVFLYVPPDGWNCEIFWCFFWKKTHINLFEKGFLNDTSIHLTIRFESNFRLFVILYVPPGWVSSRILRILGYFFEKHQTYLHRKWSWITPPVIHPSSMKFTLTVVFFMYPLMGGIVRFSDVFLEKIRKVWSSRVQGSIWEFWHFFLEIFFYFFSHSTYYVGWVHCPVMVWGWVSNCMKRVQKSVKTMFGKRC